MFKVVIGLLAVACLGADFKHVTPKHECVVSTCFASINIPYDDAGQTDNRLGVVWGTAGFVKTPIQFDNVPPGYTVSITYIRGDLVAWMHGEVLLGTNAGVLWSLRNTSSGASDTVPIGSSGCFEYVQGSVNSVNLRAAFSDDTTDEGLLDADNILWSTEAIWLNDTGRSVHAEITMIIKYRFVRPEFSSNEFAVRQ